MGYSLDDAPDPSAFGYQCPWCPTTVLEVGLGQAVKVFELHLDQHFDNPPATPAPPRPRRSGHPASTAGASHPHAA